MLGLWGKDDSPVKLNEYLFALDSKKLVSFPQKVEEYWNHLCLFVVGKWEKPFEVSWNLLKNHSICLWYAILWHHCVSKFLMFFDVLSHTCIKLLESLLSLRRSLRFHTCFRSSQFTFRIPSIDLKKKKTHPNCLLTKIIIIIVVF